MEKLNIYKKIAKLIDSFKNKKDINDTDVIRQIDSVHGFQLNISDLGTYLSNYLSKEQANMLLKNLNSNGFLSHEIGITLKRLMDNSNYDIYIKSIHDSQIESIFNEGVRCYGTSSSLATINPNKIQDVNLDNTVTKIEEFPILISNIKGNNGFSQGFNAINGTLIMQIPKDTPIEDILYFNEDSQTYNIKPSFIIGFLPVDEHQNVKDWVLPTKEEKQNSSKAK